MSKTSLKVNSKHRCVIYGLNYSAGPLYCMCWTQLLFVWLLPESETLHSNYTEAAWLSFTLLMTAAPIPNVAWSIASDPGRSLLIVQMNESIYMFRLVLGCPSPLNHMFGFDASCSSRSNNCIQISAWLIKECFPLLVSSSALELLLSSHFPPQVNSQRHWFQTQIWSPPGRMNLNHSCCELK